MSVWAFPSSSRPGKAQSRWLVYWGMVGIEDQGLLWGEDRLVFRVSGALHGEQELPRLLDLTWSRLVASTSIAVIPFFFCVVMSVWATVFLERLASVRHGVGHGGN